MGFVFGPAVGALLGQIGPTAPFFGAGILSILNLVLALFILPETKNEESQPSKREFYQYSNSEHHLKPNVQSIFMITLLYTIGFGLMEQSIALYIEHTWVNLRPTI